MAEMKKEKKEVKFEEALKRLEEIVAKLESSEISLEQSIALFEEGIYLSKFCSQKLNEAEKRITLLTKTDAGELQETPFEPDNESGLFEEKESQ
ncbi:MAG: exodeoxyribonuclease VII small subunit [bacterium]|nr:exodeoxyribonuclease VII small subunit [bacterium]